jgi:hypothetical protein
MPEIDMTPTWDAVKEWQDEAQQVHAAIAACEKGDA